MLIHSAEITGSVQFNNTDVSGITNVSGFATTASLNTLIVRTGSFATTSSVNDLQSKTGSYATTSSVNELQSKTGSYTSTSSFDAYSSSINTFTSSATTRLNTIESVTGSFASTSSVNNLQSVTGSYASTGSNQFNGNQSISGSITSNGTITAQTLVVQTVTSSVEFVTGSTRNGSLAANTHQFTGSVLMSGSLNVGGALGGTSATFSGQVIGVGLRSNATSGYMLYMSPPTGDAIVLYDDSANTRYGFFNETDSRLDLMFSKVNGAATFASSVSAPYYLVTSNIPSSTASTGYLDYSGGGTRLFSVGTSGATKGTFRFIAKGADDSSIEPLGISSTGAATFSSTVTTGDVLYVGASGGGGGTWTWGATEAYIHSPTSKNLNLTTDGGLVKGLRITTSGAATFSSTVSATELLLAGGGSWSYTTDSNWSSHQLIIPSGTLVGGGVYLIRIQFGSGASPYIVYATGLWQPVQSNGGSADVETLLTTSSHQGVGTAIYIRNQSVGGQATSALYARLSNFSSTVGSLTATATRLM
jgi:hypothetical protein